MRNPIQYAALTLAVAFMVAVVPSAYAQDAVPTDPVVSVSTDGWGDKLARGVVNIVTSPVEIGRQICKTSQEKGAAQGWSVGLVKGLGGMVIRLGSGIVDVLTFPVDYPREGKKSLVEPEYAWQDWPHKVV